ncbi:MAG: SDR family NAD(P)-dependent oxidoreductase [Burkholderiaceae bacterium]|jgi:short-subunit dehydrogenase
MNPSREFAVVTGASSGIGLELARLCAAHDMNLLIVADEPRIEQVAATLRAGGANVETLEVDLGCEEGVERVRRAIGEREVDYLLANAGRGLGRGFLEQDPADFQRVIDTNITGTVHLIHAVATQMRKRGFGRILITGSIAGFMPGSFQAVYNGTKAFLDSFSYAIREELKDTGVTVTCLMPGATDTEFFRRAGMLDTKVGTEKKADPLSVARTGFDAMLRGEGGVVAGLKNKIQAALAHVMPAETLAEMHRKEAAPETAKH